MFIIFQATQKCDKAPVRRPGRVPIRCWVGGQAQQVVCADQLDVDILVVLLRAPTEGHLVAVWRKSRGAFESIAGQRKNCRWSRWRPGEVVGQTEPDCAADQQ